MFFKEIRAVIDGIDRISWVTTAFSAGTIALLLILRRVAPSAPGSLIAVVGGIALVAAASINEHGVALIAKVPSGLPAPVVPTSHGVQGLLPGAFAIAIMVFVETIAVGRSVRQPSEPSSDNNRELVATGLSCAIGSFFRAMPSAGGFSQTAMNRRSGAHTQLSEIVTVLLAVSCALVLGPVLSDLPQATLAAMVVLAMLSVIEPASFVRFWRVSRIEFCVAVMTAASSLVFGLLISVLVGVLLTLVLVLAELDLLGVTELQPTIDGRDLRAAGEGTAAVPGLLILRLDGPLYTANVRSVDQKILRRVDDRPGTSVLVLDATAISHLPVTVLDELTELESLLGERGVTLWIAALPPQPLAAAKSLSCWGDLERGSRVHATALAAVTAYRSQTQPGPTPRETRDR